MKQLLSYLQRYYHEEVNPWYFLTMGLILGTCIYFNYEYNFENSVLDSFVHQPVHILLMFAFYSSVYLVAVLLYAVFYRRYDFLRNIAFWLTAFLGLAVLSVSSTFYYLNLYYEQLFDPSTFYFIRKCSNNIVTWFIYFIPLGMFWYLTDRHNQPLYGFRKGSLDLQPYFIMLVIMLPLVTWASYQPDFLARYPTYRREWDQSEYFYLHFFTYEFFYGADFIGVEFFFRGFMVMALARYMGAGVIVPMVSVYAFLHFGKPMGETIGSIFGGTVLGVLAYYSRSILGGIIIHVGVAYLMEFTAFLQHTFNPPAV